MNSDLEFAEWRAEWMSGGAAEKALLSSEKLNPELIRLVARKRRAMLLSLGGQLLTGAALMAFSAWFALTRPSPRWILWAVVIWLSTLFAATFSILSHAGTWSALRESNAAFLELSRRRCLRELRGLRIARWFLASQLAIVLPWLSWDYAAHHIGVGSYLIGFAATFLMSGAYLIWFSARERRTVLDLKRLDGFEDQPTS